jgi:glutamyl-tRNA synthetase
MTILRFAPSPTGRIHIGNARTAILNWLLAQKTGGQFILRYDDTDTARSKEEYAQAIAADLDWMGIKPSRVEYQSKRFDKYHAAAKKLKASGHLYPCFETAEELDRKRMRLQARHLPPIYDRAALKLSADQITEYAADGIEPHWRFKLDRQSVEWNDLIRGPVHIDTASQSDPVLIRENGTYLYTFCSVVDDIEFGITHIIRGEDHVVNAAVQIEITGALGSAAPTYGHHSLLIGADGAGLSKRLGSLSITAMRESGLEAMAVVSHAALLGTSDSIHPCADYKELVDGFDLAKLSRAPARFDEAELNHLNAKLLHMLPWDAVKNRLDYGSEAFWLAVRGNLEKLSDAKTWHEIITGRINSVVAAEDRSFVSEAAKSLPLEPWDSTTWKTWTDVLKLASDRKGKQLFMPLRLALTGLDHGPELAALLPLMGRQKVMDRLV